MNFKFKNIKFFVPVFIFVFAAVFSSFYIFFGTEKFGKGGLETPEMAVFEKTAADDVFISSLPEEIDGQLYAEENNSLVSYHIYKVQPGDMISVIAEKYGVSQDTLISVNKIKQSRLIQIGQYLKIPSMLGILYTAKSSGETVDSVAKYYKVDALKCALANGLEASGTLSEGQTIFVPDAQLDWVTRQEINGDLFVSPLKRRYYLSSNYGWRASPFTDKRSFHTGIDMATGEGTAVYPALIGKVSATGYNAVYGNYVIVAHHSGYRTLYAHLSSISCKKGQSVGTSSVIGRVGNTGLSTGPHLHFTVYKNGKTVNPLSLMK